MLLDIHSRGRRVTPERPVQEESLIAGLCKTTPTREREAPPWELPSCGLRRAGVRGALERAGPARDRTVRTGRPPPPPPALSGAPVCSNARDAPPESSARTRVAFFQRPCFPGRSQPRRAAVPPVLMQARVAGVRLRLRMPLGRGSGGTLCRSARAAGPQHRSWAS